MGRVAVEAAPSTSGRGKQLREEAPQRSGEAQLSAEQLQRSQELVGRLRGKLVRGCMQLRMHASSLVAAAPCCLLQRR